MIQEWILHSGARPHRGVAVLVDGENIPQEMADQILEKSKGLGALAIKRVYGQAAKLARWDNAPEFRSVHAECEDSSTDLLLAVEAVTLCHEGIDTVVIASSGRDFGHLAKHLRGRQITVIGMGGTTAPDSFRKTCSEFVELQAG